uniref:Protein VACUOLELESS1 n=1 Tax=Brassica campestris TaxID=3711 RepID=M4C757_BRACM
MANVSVAAEWQLLYNRYYRKPEIYQMRWKHVDLSRNKVACASFGGPIAVIRDDSKIVQLYAESALRKLRIFNSAGVLLSETVWKHPGGRLIGMSWSDDQTLISIVQDGTIYCYNIHAELIQPNVTMGKECFEQNVVECVFWGNGVVCLTEGGQLFCISDFKTMKPYKLADVPGLTDDDMLQPTCLAVREPQYTMSGNVEVLVAVGDEIYVVDEDEAQSIRFDEPSVEDSEMQNDDYGNLIGPVQKMIVSPNGKFLTLFTHDGRIVVVGMESKQIAIDYSCESALPPQQMAWCGMDSVLLYWDEDLMMVGPLGDPVHYFYDEPVILIPECDGVRILSNTSLEFLQRVPDSTESIFKIGSTSPAALLYDALDHFDRRSAKADENLRLIRSSLSEAVESCIDAAGHEFDVNRQRALLRAASYGQAFSSNFQRDRVQETCRTLRVLNAVRDPDIGIPLSIQQYKLLTPVVLISRLINAHSHFLALRISEYLGMNKEVVIMHWACAKITASASTPDAHLLEILLDKVPLLLSIGEEDTALVKATESGDTDLVYLVIFHIWQKRPPLEFFAMIQGRILARDLFVAYARCHKQEFLKDFFLSTGQIHEVAFLLWKESWDMGKNPMASKGSPLHGPRIKLIEKASNLFSQTKEHTFESKAAEEHAKLLRIQHELEASTKQAIFVDSSINDTIRTCIVLRNNRAAAKVKSEFKVSDKRWYWLKTFALATIKDWEALEKFSKEKRPPTGFRPFVEACIDADEKAEALKYIPKLSDLVERGEAYARIGMAKEAADAAAQANDGGELLERFRKTFSQNAIFDTLKMPFQGVS